MRAQHQELGRRGDCYLLTSGDEQCVQLLWDLLWAVTQVSQVEGRWLSWAELGVQQVQKLELQSLSAGWFFSS